MYWPWQTKSSLKLMSLDGIFMLQKRRALNTFIDQFGLLQTKCECLNCTIGNAKHSSGSLTQNGPLIVIGRLIDFHSFSTHAPARKRDAITAAPGHNSLIHTMFTQVFKAARAAPRNSLAINHTAIVLPLFGHRDRFYRLHTAHFSRLYEYSPLH